MQDEARLLRDVTRLLTYLSQRLIHHGLTADSPQTYCGEFAAVLVKAGDIPVGSISHHVTEGYFVAQIQPIIEDDVNTGEYQEVEDGGRDTLDQAIIAVIGYHVGNLLADHQGNE